jgi:hypothetical protein
MKLTSMKASFKNIAIIIPYFGKLPWYFAYFIHSCSYNPDIHFFIITDDYNYTESPENVFIIRQSFQELKILIGEKLQLSIAFNDPYKLCDFRPAFGVIFDKILKDYDFWGHSDIDVIFGNIKKFITQEMLNNYDIISMRNDYVLGCFCLYKNVEKINMLFTRSKDYKKIFTASKHYCFDETNFHYDEFADNLHYSKINSEIESMTHLVKKMDEKNEIEAYFDFHIIEGLPGELKWDNGVLTYKNEWEAILYHLIKLKKIYSPPNVLEKMPNIFFIGTSEIRYKL